MSIRKDAAQMLIDTINATGGLLNFSNGTYAPLGDPDWIDLGEAYLAACAQKESTPMVAADDDTEFEARAETQPVDLTHEEPEPVSLIDIHAVLVTSTAHLTFRDSNMLTRVGYRRGECGWLLYVGLASDPMPEVDLPSAGLVGAILCARDKGCVYLLFDDGRRLPGVPTIW
jgi:hypothetical protein